MGQRGTVIALYAYIREVNNLSSHLNKLENEEQKKPKVNRKKSVIKRRAGEGPFSSGGALPRSLSVPCGHGHGHRGRL